MNGGSSIDTSCGNCSGIIVVYKLLLRFCLLITLQSDFANGICEGFTDGAY